VGRFCLIIVGLEPPDGMVRATFLISRRFSVKAVVRNRARRLFREVFRRLLPSLPPVWLLFIPRRHITGAKMGDVEREAVELLDDLLLGGAGSKPFPAKRETEDSAQHTCEDR
jgi:ribonuclease P protein component